MATELTAPIKIRPVTKAAIEARKVHHRETIDEVLTRLLDEREAREAAAKAAS